MHVARRSWGIVAVGLFLTIVSTATAKYSGGTGEPNDPYQIATAADLIALGETPEDYDKHFLLAADIDLDPNLPGRKVFDRAVIAPDANDMADWFQGTPFTGVFDGNGHAISRLTIAGKDCLGLFGHSRGEVRDLGVVHVNVSGSDYVGGLVGANSGSLTRCYSTGAVSGDEYVGGLVGQNNGSVFQCYSAGAVAAASFVGGLVAQNSGSITQCYCAGTVNATGSRVGGLVGVNYSIVNDCYSTGAVEGDWYVGGLVGDNAPPSGPVEGHSWLGYCYCTAKVSGKNNVGPLVGGPTGLWNVMSCFYETQTPDQVWNAPLGSGLTTAQMQTAKTFLNAEWDFVGETDNGTEDIWKIAEGLGYPRLAWEKYSSGTGEPNDPYQIATAVDLIALGEDPNDYDKHFIMTADIDLDPNLPGRKVFDKAVIAPDADPGYTAFWGPVFGGIVFTGVFDGNGHTISHLMIQGGYYVGLFGQLEGGEVKNLGVVDVNIKGSGYRAGGLAGSNGELWGDPGTGSTVTRCHSSGAVTGGNEVGGLIGWDYRGNIAECYSSGTVDGNDSVGGLVGVVVSDTITNCYSMSSVSGRNTIAGLVGHGYPDCCCGLVSWCWSPPSIRHCYSVGVVSGRYVGGIVASIVLGPPGEVVPVEAQIARCFWDTQVSGLAVSAGGTGKTTAEMQTAKTFLDAGWDFVGETANGSEDVWKIAEGLGYPRLSWQKYSGGTGEPNDPYQIATAADLIALGETPVDYDKHFILTADIDLDPNLPGRRVFDKAVIGAAWPGFAGVFVGRGHAISHLTIKGADDLGLFGLLASGAEVRDLQVVDVNIVGSDWVAALISYNWGTVTRCYGNGTVSGDFAVGGLVGTNDGALIQCHNTGAVSGNGDVGGLVGDNVGTVTHCYSRGTVSGTGEDVGGLVGTNASGTVAHCYSTGIVTGNGEVGGLIGYSDGTVTHCHSTGAVSGEAYVGGLVGCNDDGTITHCYGTGAVSGDGTVGGLIGYSDGTVTQCHSTGAASGKYKVGGLVGENYGGNVTQCYSTGGVSDSGSIWDSDTGGLVGYNIGEITHSYSTGAVRGTDSVGGLVGFNGGTVTQCYCDGAVSGASYVGGLVGLNTDPWGKEGIVTRCFWDIKASGQSKSTGGTGKTTAEMQMAKTFLDAGWDFVGETANGTEDIWRINEGKDYPRLWWEQGDEASQF